MRFKTWAILILVLAIAGAGGWAYWDHELRWRPKTITKHQAEIVKLLETSGWVSPKLPGRKLYMVSYHTCTDCIRFKLEEFPRLHARGVDTRVIVIALADKNGMAQSTPAERATVAQLWIGRDWELLKRWDAAPVTSWAAPGIAPADGDMARTAVVEAGRTLADKLRPLLRDNGIRLAYPTLIWWDAEGKLRGCACERRETYRFLRKELGV